MKTVNKLFSLLVLLALLLAMTPIQPAHAAVIRYAKPSATGTGNCLSWDNACLLTTALTNSVSGNEIWVMSGTHKPTTTTSRTATFQLKSGVAVYGGFAGTETARTQRNPATNVTVLSGDVDNNDSQTPIITDLSTVTGNTTNSYHVVTGATAATLDGFTITAGCANVTSEPNSNGGGMYNNAASPTLVNVKFKGNFAYRYGGGMYNNFSRPRLTNVTFSGNTAIGTVFSAGGGMYNYDSDATLINASFTGNLSESGGGMSNESCSPTLSKVTFSTNSAASGGGMYNFGSSPTMMEVTFSSNTASNKGGGMVTYAYGNPKLTDVIFENNSAANTTADGGAIYSQESGLTLTNVTFTGNWALDDGGAMLLWMDGNDGPILTNVTFNGNTAYDNGGGIYSDYAHMTLTNVTFTNNSALKGGAMYERDDTHIRNTIFWGNTATIEGSQIYFVAGPLYVDDSVVEGGCPAGVTCTNIYTDDPLLGTPGNHGGFTQTIPILDGSSAIDTGKDSLCPATDQRGMVRPQGAHCDIGAFEYESNATATFTSVGAQDGWILESSEASTKGGTLNATTTTFNLGDQVGDKQYRTILSFNTASLPDTAVIIKAMLKINKQGLVGSNPFMILGGLKVDIRKPFFGTTAGLVISDFQAPAGKAVAGVFGTTPVSNWYSASLFATGYPYIHKTGTTQFRLYFTKDDNDDNGADYMKFYSGNYAYASAKPTLIVEYYVP